MSFKSWQAVHTWSSLVCTVFLLVVFASGLPLVFNDALTTWLDGGPDATANRVPCQPPADLDNLVAEAQRLHPRHRVTRLRIHEAHGSVIVDMSPRPGAMVPTEKRVSHWIAFDRWSGMRRWPSAQDGSTLGGHTAGARFMTLMLRLHIDFFAGLWGQLLLCLMSVLFVLAVVSGLVLYPSFMKNRAFGTVRVERPRRIQWLDLHNLLGIVTVSWALMIGLTGALHELAVPLFRYWLATDVREVVGAVEKTSSFTSMPLVSVQRVADRALEALPDHHLDTLMYPDARHGLPHHYLLWVKRESRLGDYLFDGMLVDARTGTVSAILSMPWYLRVIQIARPLHYGDFAGLPLKWLWVLLDLITLAVLGSGLYLWMARRKGRRGGALGKA